MGNLLNKAVVKTVKFLDEAPSNPKKLIKGSPGLNDNPKILLKGKGSPPSNPKILLKGKGNPPSNPKIVVKDGKGSATAKLAKKQQVDSDVEISDLLTRVRDGVVGDKYKKADAKMLKKNLLSMTPEEQTIVKGTLANLKPGQTINDLIKFGKEKKKALIVASAVSPGIANADQQSDEEGQVLSQFEAFQKSPEGQAIIGEVDAEFEQRKNSFKPEEAAKRGAFVMSRIKQGDSISDIKAFLINKNLGKMDIGPALIEAGKSIRDIGLTGGVDESRVKEMLSLRGFTPLQVEAIFEEGAGKGIQGEIPLLPPEDGNIKEAKTAAEMTIATPEEERAQMQQAVLDSFIDPKDFNIAELDAMTSQTHSRLSTTLDTVKGFLGDKQAANRAKLANIELDNQISSVFNKYGVVSKVVVNPNTNTSDIMVTDEKGVERVLDIPIYDQLVEGIIANRANLSTVVGAFFTGGAVAAESIPLAAWELKPLVAIAGGSVAAGAAAALGTGADTVRNSISLRQQINTSLLKEQMKEALVFESALGLAGTITIKGAATILKTANDFLIAGNKQGAISATMQISGMTKARAEDKIALMQRTLGLKIGKNESIEDVFLRILPRTEPRLTGAVQIATKHRPISSVDVAEEVNIRAKQVIDATSNATDANIGTIVSEELTKYTKKVSADYAAVKDIAIQEIDSLGTYTFDYNKLAIEPVLQRMEKSTGGFEATKLESIVNNIRDLGAFDVSSSKTELIGTIKAKGKPITAQDALNASKVKKKVKKGEVNGNLLNPNKLKRAKKGESKSRVPSVVATQTTPVVVQGNSKRTFSDLLELRVAVNQLTSSKTLKTFADRSGARDVIKTIDSEITRVMKDTPDGETWLKLWDVTNQQYGKYKEVKENILFKALTSGGKDNEAMVDTLSKHIGDIDNTFMEVVEKLPLSVRGNTEDAILNKFVGDFKVGRTEDIQAVHYPKLAERLNQINFTTPKARTTAKVLKDMGAVLQADPHVGVATDNISIEAFKSAFTADPIVRAKMTLASSSVNYVRRYLPGEAGRASALVTTVARTFANPMDIKSVNKMIKDMPNDSTIEESLKQLRISNQQFGKSKDSVRVTSGDIDANVMTPTTGSLGKGVYFKSNEEFFKGTNNRLTNILVRPERMATINDIENLVGVEKFSKELLVKDPTIKRRLQELGFIGLSIVDDVMLF